MKVPLTDFVAGAAAALVGVAAGVWVCELFVAADLLGVAFLGGVEVAAFVGAALCASAAGVEAVAPPAPGNAIEVESADVNVGGVIAKTAPNPPTVPVAISIARFTCKPSRALL